MEKKVEDMEFDTLNKIVIVKARMERPVLERLRKEGYSFEEINEEKEVEENG